MLRLSAVALACFLFAGQAGPHALTASVCAVVSLYFALFLALRRLTERKPTP